MSAPCPYCGVRPDVPCRHKIEVAAPRPVPVEDVVPDRYRVRRGGARSRRKVEF